MRFGWSSKASFQRVLWLAIGSAIIVTLLYFLIYWYQPFSEFWNNLLSNFFTPLASLTATLLAVMIWSMYERTDTPRSIWGYFALGLALWFAGEVSWGYYNMTVGEVSIGLPDVFWCLAYFFFGHALIRQYRIVRQPTTKELLVRILLGIVTALLLTLAIVWLVIKQTDTQALFNAVVNSFYPAADLIVAVIALRLARNFSGGAFSRPWLGLLVFTFSDLLYAWAEASGMYAWSLEQGNLLTTVVDLTYLIAYLVLALGVLYQWLFLKYGLRLGSGVR
jgi:hypothetical protein